MKPRRRILHVLWRAARHFYDDDGFDRAAAIAFYSLLSLGPLLYLLGMLVRSLLPDDDAVGAVVSRGAAAMPPELLPALERVVRGLPAGEGLVLLALPGLLWVATTGLTALEYGINVAYDTVPDRRFWLSRLKSFSVVSAAALFLVLSLIAGHGLAWLDGYRERLELPPALGPGASWIAGLTLLAVGFGAFTAFYKFFPRGAVAWWAAAAAALPALLLWEAARRLFGLVVSRSPSYGLLTGALASAVALLLWIYTAAAIVLLGAEIAAILNGNRPAD